MAASRPFLAALWLHTPHTPHPALPRFYFGYNDSYGGPAGDYLGAISQMDEQVGRLRRLLQQTGVYENTLLWFSSDNGPVAPTRMVQFLPEAQARLCVRRGARRVA